MSRSAMSMTRKLLAVVASLVTCHVSPSSLDVECKDCHAEAVLNVSLNPLADKWKGFRLQDFMEEFGCNERTELKIPDEEAWMIMRKLYQDIVGEKSTIAPLSNESGMKVPFYVAHVPGKGRAVFASQPVKKGTLVWDERQEGDFFDGDSFRKFLVSLPTELRCDALMWSWAENRDGVLLIATAFDEGSMFNDNDHNPVAEEEDDETEMDSPERIFKQNGEMASTGGGISEIGMIRDKKDLHMDDEDADEEESKRDDGLPNTGCVSETAGEDCLVNYALRDIEAGEEITCDYSEFFSDEAYDYLGLK
eukprot:scaffold152579_cov45-Attheya_sp.AAC.1